MTQIRHPPRRSCHWCLRNWRLLSHRKKKSILVLINKKQKTENCVFSFFSCHSGFRLQGWSSACAHVYRNRTCLHTLGKEKFEVPVNPRVELATTLWYFQWLGPSRSHICKICPSLKPEAWSLKPQTLKFSLNPNPYWRSVKIELEASQPWPRNVVTEITGKKEKFVVPVLKNCQVWIKSSKALTSSRSRSR